MNRPKKEQLVYWLLAAAVVLVGTLAFVVFFKYGLEWLGIVLKYIAMLIVPFAVAWLIAVITHPINQFLVERAKIPPSLAVLMVLLIIAGILVGMGWLVVAVVSDVLSELSYYAENLEYYTRQILEYVALLYDKLNLDLSSVEKMIDTLQDSLTKFASSGMDTAWSIVKGTPGLLVMLLVTIVATFYWSREEYRVRDFLINLSPKKFRTRIRRTYDDVSRVVGGYIRAQAVLVTISVLICIIGFSIIGADSPLAMGLFAGVMDIIPILGPGTLIVPWAVWSVVMGKYGFAAGLIVIYAIVSVSRYILEPKIVGDRVGLHPLGALAAIFIGMQMFGLVGLILGPIVLAVVVAVVKTRRQQQILIPDDK